MVSVVAEGDTFEVRVVNIHEREIKVVCGAMHPFGDGPLDVQAVNDPMVGEFVLPPGQFQLLKGLPRPGDDAAIEQWAAREVGVSVERRCEGENEWQFEMCEARYLYREPPTAGA